MDVYVKAEWAGDGGYDFIVWVQPVEYEPNGRGIPKLWSSGWQWVTTDTKYSAMKQAAHDWATANGHTVKDPWGE